MQNSISRPPAGFKFVPTDEELINYYVYNKVNGRLSGEVATLIKEYNLYGEEEPWEIFNKFQGHKFGDNGLYFFTTLHKKTSNGIKNMNRSVGNNGGTWHGDSSKEVESSEGIVIGTKKRFRYKKYGQSVKYGWILVEYGSESISESIVISQLKKSEYGSSKKESTSRKRKYKNAEVFEVAGDDDIMKIMQSIGINSEPIMSPAQESQQVIHNQEMWPEAETVLMVDDGGRSTEVAFDDIQKMELGASVIVNSGPILSQAQEQQQITENQEMWLEQTTVELENDGGFSTEASFKNEAAINNLETMNDENQQMALASCNDDEGVCPAAVVCDKMGTSDNAVPAVSALPVTDAGFIQYLKNETNWFANFQALQMEEC